MFVKGQQGARVLFALGLFSANFEGAVVILGERCDALSLLYLTMS